MPVKLIGILVLVVLVAVMTGFNLQNKCNIWVFHEFKDVSVFALILGSFISGVLVTIPFSIVSTAKKKKNTEKKTEQETKEDSKEIENQQ